MPEVSELPDTMRDLHSYNAAKVNSGSDFRMHMRRLVNSVNETLGIPGTPDDLTAAEADAGAGAFVAAALRSRGFDHRGSTGRSLRAAVEEIAGCRRRGAAECRNARDPAEITAWAKQHGGYIFPDSDQRLLSEQDFKGMSPVELRIARNEIYARRGQFFVDRILADYFSQFLWYHPRQVEVDLSPLEQTNVNTIKLAEGQK